MAKPSPATSTTKPAEKPAAKATRMTFSRDASTLVWTATENGQTLRAEFDVSRAPQELFEVARDHGFKQKIADSAAKSVDTDTGKSAPLAEKFAAMQRTIDNLYDGKWNAVREGGNLSILCAALASITGKPEADVRKKVETWSEDQITAAYRDPRVIRESAEIRAKRFAGSNEIADQLIASI